jgi:proteasome assembly chaperone (PAC2) family protein
MYGKRDKNGSNEEGFLLITSDAQSLNPKGIYKISNFLSEIIHNSGVELVVALGAYPVNKKNLKEGIPRVYASSTNKELLNKYLSKNGCQKIDKGVIIGANGLIPTLTKARFDINGLVLLAETDNVAIVNEDLTDLKASITLLELLKRSFSLPINDKYSLENIDSISKNLQSKRDELERNLEEMSLIESEEKKKSLYI